MNETVINVRLSVCVLSLRGCAWLQVTDSNGRVILFIDEIHTVVGAGASEGSMDAGVLDLQLRV